MYIIIYFPNLFICLRVWNGCTRTQIRSCRRDSRLDLSISVWISPPSTAYMRQCTWLSLVQVMACRLFGAKSLAEPMLFYRQSDPWEQVSVKLEFEFYHFHWIWIDNIICQDGGHFVCASMCQATPMVELQMSYAGEHCIQKPMLYCSNTVVVAHKRPIRIVARMLSP